MAKTLAEMAAEVEVVNRDKGWYDDKRTFLDSMFLLASEVIEAGEAWREIGFAERTRAPKCDHGAHAACACLGKPDDVASELADVLIRLLDDAARNGIDLEAEYERKMAYNRTRPYRHGGKLL